MSGIKPYTLIMGDRLVGHYATQGEAESVARDVNRARVKNGGEEMRNFWRVYHDPYNGSARMVSEGRE